MLMLMLTKRNERLKRLAADIERQRESPTSDAVPEEARRVDNTAFFLNIRAMQEKGGAGNVPLC